MKKNAYKIITVALFGLILVLLPMLTFINMPSDPKPFSENENRYLKAFPAFDFESFRDESFMEDFEEWFSDRFFGRENWIRLKNGTERLIGKTDINGVFTEDDRMIEIWKGFDREYTEKNLNAVKNFAESCPDKPVYFLLAPTSQEIYSDIMPKTALLGSQTELLGYCRDLLSESRNISVIDVMTELKKHSQDYICYRTDHHWTSLGAYYAYYEAANAMGFKPTELSGFDIEHVSYDFRGTLYSKTLDDGVTPDIIDYFHPKEDEKIKLTVNNGEEIKVYDSLYFREYLDVKDKYSSFTGPNVPCFTIETQVDGPSLLMFKDSYAHSFIPFLTAHYGRITVLDLRYIRTGYRTIMTALCFYTMP